MIYSINTIPTLQNVFATFKKNGLFPHYTAEALSILEKHVSRVDKIHKQILKDHGRQDEHGQPQLFVYKRSVAPDQTIKHSPIDFEIKSDIKGKTEEELKAMPEFAGLDVYWGQVVPEKHQEYKQEMDKFLQTKVSINGKFASEEEEDKTNDLHVLEDDQLTPIEIKIKPLSSKAIENAESKDKLNREDVIDAITILYNHGLVYES